MSEDTKGDVAIDNVAIGHRLRAAMARKLTIAAAATIAGVTPKTMQRWLAGHSSIDIGGLLAICRELGIQLSDITGEAGVDAVGGSASSFEQAAMTRVPMFDVFASAGDGAFVPRETPIGYTAFPTDFLSGLGQPTKMELIRVHGDSMEPDLRSGDLVMIDTTLEGRTERVREGIWLVNLDDVLVIKWLRRTGSGRVQLSSSNPRYASLEAGLDDGTFRIVGRAVWSGRSLG